ncbi:hypothetical protein N8I74_10925 [Chitiniphilus purpureus]|uniref:Uncharacterized protein n=1 Tax=Chitiniphilus purpureus TaxID=2981137 RepID=A0ABY6DHK4_9NEIS|nr:hypothetical protein [Chitiniphilus sp. CD1]UXY13835.1 hypothetical protein N8I74_10925 [Chitiniphilus sp. CD1]
MSNHSQSALQSTQAIIDTAMLGAVEALAETQRQIVRARDAIADLVVLRDTLIHNLPGANVQVRLNPVAEGLLRASLHIEHGMPDAAALIDYLIRPLREIGWSTPTDTYGRNHWICHRPGGGMLALTIHPSHARVAP